MTKHAAAPDRIADVRPRIGAVTAAALNHGMLTFGNDMLDPGDRSASRALTFDLDARPADPDADEHLLARPILGAVRSWTPIADVRSPVV